MQAANIAKLCVIPVCGSDKFSLVHKFPADNERNAEWMSAINQHKPIAKLQNMTPEAVRKRYFICSRHFSLKEYKNAESRSLNLTAVPSLNLNDLDELHLSKAWMLENRSVVNNAENEEIEKPVAVAVQPPRILNSGATQSSATKAEQIIKRVTTQSVKVLNKSVDQEIDVFTLEPPEKRAKMDLSEECITLKTKIPTKKTPTKESPKAKKIIEAKTKNGPPKKATVHPPPQKTTSPKKLVITSEKAPADETPTNKLLALIEVTPEQYEKLSKSLSTTERSENVASLLNFIDKEDVLADSAMDQVIEVELKSGEQLALDLFWLRDHCQCDNCYDHSTFQRKVNVLDIPDDIKAKSHKVQGEKLNVIWSDKHSSSYSIDFLLKNQPNQIKIQNERCLWTKDTLEGQLKTCHVSMRDYMSDPEISKKVLKSLHVYGVAFIDGVQPKQENTEFVIRQLFPIQKTLFGEMWTFSDAKKDHSDTAYTNIYLGPHNDNTYYNDAAGLQIFHCILFDGTGGENFLIDGFQVAEKLKQKQPEVFDRLTRTLVTAEYIEEGRHHKHTAPLVILNPITGEIEQVRFNLYDRSPFKPTGNIRQFYSDLKILATEFENLENRVTVKLTPGTVMIFDNWRVLHGRLSYTGKRTMTGCYVARTEFQSALRVNNFID